MNSQRPAEYSFVPISMIKTQEIESRMRRDYTQFLAKSLMHLVKLTTAPVIDLTDTIFTRLGQRKLGVR